MTAALACLCVVTHVAQMSRWMSSGSQSRLKINISGHLMQYWVSAALVVFINLSVNRGVPPPHPTHPACCISPLLYAVTLLDPGRFCWIAISYQICSRSSTGNTGADCHSSVAKMKTWWMGAPLVHRLGEYLRGQHLADKVQINCINPSYCSVGEVGGFLAASRMVLSWSGPICVRSITMLVWPQQGPAGKRI